MELLNNRGEDQQQCSALLPAFRSPSSSEKEEVSILLKFLTGELRPEGKDLCDMSGAVDRTPDQYTVYNAMLPRRYSKEFLAESQLYAER